MHKRNELQKKLQTYLPLHGARIGFIELNPLLKTLR